MTRFKNRWGSGWGWLLLAAAVNLVGSCISGRGGEGPRAALQSFPPAAVRTLAQLDVNGDGQLNDADAALFESVADAAISRNAEPWSVDVGLYNGPPSAAGSVFSVLDWDEKGVKVDQVPVERRRELALEARWAALQVRFASFRGPIEADSRHFHGVLVDDIPGYHPEVMDPASVCRAIEGFPHASYAAAGLPRIAVFDLDSTVWLGNISDLFLAAMIEQQVIREEANVSLRGFLKTVPGIDASVVDRNSAVDNAQLLFDRATDRSGPAAHRVSPKDAFYNTVGLLRGLTRAEVEAVARMAMERGAGPYPPWKSRLYAHPECGMRRLVEVLQANGFDVYLLSATLDVLAEVGGDHLGVSRSRVLGSVLEQENGFYTGKVKDSTYYAKGAIVRQWLPAPPIFAFGDSPTSDFSMLLEAAGAGFVVNARPRFKERDAKEAGGRLVEMVYRMTEAGERL